jgi:hypothetical protein
MTHPDQPTDVPPYLSAEIVRSRVASMLDGSPLQIEERANELAITDPADPEAGTIHVAYADGYVCWERVTWKYWGHLEGCEPDHDAPDTSVHVEKIISTLNRSPSGPEAA